MYAAVCNVLYDSVCIGLLDKPKIVSMSGSGQICLPFYNSTEETICLFDVMLLNLSSLQDTIVCKVKKSVLLL